MRLKADLNYALLAVLAGFAIQWVEIGPLPISQIAILLSAVFFFLGSRAPMPYGHDVDAFKIYAVFTLVLLLALSYSQDIGAGISAIARSAVYLGLTYLFYSWLRSMPTDICINSLARAVFYVAPTFFVFFLLSASSAGVNIIEQVVRAVSAGNPNWLQYQVFTVVLNNGDLDENGYSSAARHGIMVSLMTVAHLHLFLRNRKTMIGTLLCAIIYALVLFSLSRSAILGLLMGLICVFTVHLATGNLPIKRIFLVVLAAVLLAPMFGMSGDGGVVAIISEKFVADIADNPRVYEFVQIIDLINESAVLGSGTGSPLNLFGLSAQYPHNFILYAWHQAGLPGLLVSAAFVILVCAKLVAGVSRAMRTARTSPRASRAYLLSAMLLCVVIVRLMFAKAGLLAVPEWIALALALYCQRVAVAETAQDTSRMRQPGLMSHQAGTSNASVSASRAQI